MADYRSVLGLLAGGGFCSGEEIGRRLGVSRAAVWKHLQKLEELDINIESVRGRGYRLVQPLELIDPKAVFAGLSGEAATLVDHFELLESVDSTNRHALDAGLRGDGCYVCTAERQTAGRGRRGKAWISPYGRNIYLSIARRFESGIGAIEGLSLAVGVETVAALQSRGAADLALKWPNDILWRGAKVAGILLEIAGNPEGPTTVVVGIGINVSMSAALARGIDQPWADLASMPGADAGRNGLLTALLDRLLPMLVRFERDGFGPWRERWESIDAFRDALVVLKIGERAVAAGRARGVDETGAIALDTGDGLRYFNGGEISLREAR